MGPSLLLLVLVVPHAWCKVFERCELVRELSQKKYRIPPEDVATWVCIARHESEFNTSAVGRLNADGSGDHGLFQISDQFWCSPPGVGQACGLNCDQLEDDDIKDDVVCARRIFRAHKRRTGDGFSAWAVYGPHCRGDVSAFTKDCENPSTSSPDKTKSKNSPSETEPPSSTAASPPASKEVKVIPPYFQKPAGPSAVVQSFSKTAETGSNLGRRPTNTDAWLDIHYDPAFLDQFP